MPTELSLMAVERSIRRTASRIAGLTSRMPRSLLAPVASKTDRVSPKRLQPQRHQSPESLAEGKIGRGTGCSDAQPLGRFGPVFRNERARPQSLLLAVVLLSLPHDELQDFVGELDRAGRRRRVFERVLEDFVVRVGVGCVPPLGERSIVSRFLEDIDPSCFTANSAAGSSMRA